jgi:hypothetical protein
MFHAQSQVMVDHILAREKWSKAIREQTRAATLASRHQQWAQRFFIEKHLLRISGGGRMVPTVAEAAPFCAIQTHT